MKYLVLILLLLPYTPVVACDCYIGTSLTEAQKDNFELSDLIFVGEVVASDPGTGIYQFKVQERFKGNVKGNTVTGKVVGYCSRFPRKEEGLWLVYATVSEEGYISISDCSLSRPFHAPFGFHSEIYLPPPPIPSKDPLMDELLTLWRIAEARQKALLELKKEIEQLREWK